MERGFAWLIENPCATGAAKFSWPVDFFAVATRRGGTRIPLQACLDTSGKPIFF
jgi:hypothetical protein